MIGDRPPTIPTHLSVSYGDYTSASLAAALNHMAGYASDATAVLFTEDGVFDATDRAIEALSKVKESAAHIRGARHW